MTIKLLHGDCRDVLKTLPDASVDSIVTDPPYHLTTGKNGGSGPASVNLESPYGRARIGTGFMGMKWDGGDIAHNVEMWAECLRVLKPGGHLLAFGGTRTFHRLACAIEDAGFELRDSVLNLHVGGDCPWLAAWVFGSGFPKSLDVSKAIDAALGAPRELSRAGEVKRDGYGGDWDTGSSSSRPRRDEPATDAANQWQGWGTALKPAFEPIVMARKPLIGTVAANVLAHGVGGLNIEACKVHGADAPGGGYTVKRLKPGATLNATGGNWRPEGEGPLYQGETTPGRWPANLIHDGSDEVLAAFPQAPGQIADASSSSSSRKTQNVYGAMKRGNGREGEPSQDSDNVGAVGFRMKPGARRGDSGGAARFFYCAKASPSDRGPDNTHPTVKPTDLMRYLCRLVTPPGGTVLDPFAGSGSTLKAAELEGFDAIGIELSAEYIEIARRRIASDTPLFTQIESAA